MDRLKQRYLKELSDIPRWVETRALLAWEGSSIIASRDGDGFVVWSKNDNIGSIVGNIDLTSTIQAANDCSELLAFPENIHIVQQQLGDFQAERATIFQAPNSFPTSLAHSCKLLGIPDIASMSHIPDGLKDELLSLEEDNPLLMAAFEGCLPVAFAYVASETDTLWDVSIDTLESYRRKGYATSAIYALMKRMKDKGKSAVWGAVRGNVASLNLAHKLGFVAVDELWVLTRSDIT